MTNFLKFFLATFLIASTAIAGLPPTTAKNSSDASDITTFKYQFPNFTGTHTGTVFSLGVNSVAGGGTGLGSLTANSVLLGNGTSNPTFVAPGTSGNILTSNGTTWTSATSTSLTNPMTSVGDIIIGTTAGAPARLGVGTPNQALTVLGSQATPSWNTQNQNPAKNYINGNYNADVDTALWTTYSDTQAVTITNASPAVFTVTSTTLFGVGLPVTFTSTGTLPTGLTSGTTYFISLVVSGTTFQVSATLGGASLSTSSAGSGTHTFRPLKPISLTSNSLSGLTFSRNTTTPLKGAGDFKLAQTNATIVAGQGVYFGFTLDNSDQGLSHQISFNFNADTNFSAADGLTPPNSGGVGDSDLEIFLYDVTNTNLVPITGQVITAKGSNNFVYTGNFQSAPNSTSYRLSVHAAKASAAATGYNFRWDNVYVSPIAPARGPPVTDPIAYTPTFVGAGTVTSPNVFYYRSGKYLYVEGSFVTGTPTAVPFSVALPLGLTIDLASEDSNQVVGKITNQATTTAGTPTFAPMFLQMGTASNLVYVSNISIGGVTNNLSALTGLNIFIATTKQSFEFKVAIAGWSSNLLISNDTDTRIVAVNAPNQNPTGTIANNYTIAKFGTIAKDTHAAYSTSTGLYTVPVSGWYQVNATLAYASTSFGINGAGGVGIGQNGTIISANTDVTGAVGMTGAQATIAYVVFANAGDTLGIYSIASGGTVTFSSSATGVGSSFSINRLSGPATIAVTDQVNARYFSSATSLSGTLATITYATKDFDSHGAYASGTYTVPVSGKFQINAALLISGTFALNATANLSILKNGAVVAQDLVYAASVVTATPVKVSDIINCVAGDTIQIQAATSAGSPAIVSSNTTNKFSIARVSN